MSKITVILFTYNRTYYLKLAIESIVNQTYKDYELYIMDNGSSPDTFEIIKPYLCEKIKYHRNPVNSRNYVNEAFTKGEGEYLLITHDDDIMMSNMLEKEVEILENNQNCVMVGCNVALIDENGIVFKKRMNRNQTDHIFKRLDYIKSFLKCENISLFCPTIMLRRDFFIKNNFQFNMTAGPSMDNYLWFEVNLQSVDISIISEPLYFYRVHNLQDSNVNNFIKELIMFEKTIELLKHNLGLEKENQLIVLIIAKIALNNAYAFKYGKITKDELKKNLEKCKNYMIEWQIKSFKINIILFLSFNLSVIFVFLHKVYGKLLALKWFLKFWLKVR